MTLDDFDFDLPAEQIAQYPAARRDQARLLVVHRGEGTFEHRRFSDIIDYIAPDDTLALNQTRVFPARLHGQRRATGGRVELMMIRPAPDDTWLAMGRPARRLVPGTELLLGAGQVEAHIVENTGGGRVRVRFAVDDVAAFLEQQGQVPLPPYIRRDADDNDRQRYQTVFAQQPGAIAAPTAGLHFTEELLAAIKAVGTTIAPVLLHVGPGTFEPMRQADPRQHRIEAEYYEVGAESAAQLSRCRQQGGRVWAVGTTSVRTLETCARQDGGIEPGTGWSDLYIYPPYSFRAVDVLVTNFHLPRSSLLLLVAAFAGRELVLKAYAEALAAGYQFYSYGDAMLVL
ncbi:MAG: tRNA preQ1(34) S-adenosylmethionine ribosyltransferase-isomerase QueA [Candidatus Latescibacteria bacterium]|nr:tRNA preQ1(34) S-adenosylmethionine ribosyltransferase-isomerase QueA [Candidatus Latescibacterota bacterium]